MSYLLKTHLGILLSLLFFHSVFSQEIVRRINDPNADFYEVQKFAEKYFKENGTGKGTGYKIYKRWEHEKLISRTANGKFSTIKDRNLEFQKVAKARALRAKSSLVGNVFSELGPHKNNVTSHYSPGMGVVRAMCVDPQNQQILYAAGVGGVWKSLNQGTTWAPLTDHLPGVYSFAVAVHPSNSNIVIAGTNGLGVMKSNDGGATWNTTSLDYGVAKKILFHPTNPSIVLVAATYGVFRSTDGGNTFTNTSTQFAFDMDFKPGDPNIVYLSTNNGFYRSGDNGNSFAQITNGIPVSYNRMLIAVTAANPNYVYVVVASDDSGLGFIYRSNNSGVSFTTQLAASPANGTNYFSYGEYSSGGQAWHDMAVIVSPTNAEFVIIGGINLYASTTGGTVFQRLTDWTWGNSYGYVHADIQALEWAGNTVYCGSDGGLFKSTNNGDDWLDISTGMGNREFYCIGGTEADPYYIGGGSQDNGQSLMIQKGVNEWRDWMGADGMEIAVDPLNKNVVYACYQMGGLWKTSNAGMSTDFVVSPAESGNWVTPLFVDPISPNTVYIGKNELWKSTDGGVVWNAISAFGNGSPLEAATISKSNNQYIYAADGSNIWVTKNGGASWTNISNGINGGINYIDVNPANENKVSLVTYDGVFKSDNAGTTWQNITYDLPNVGKRCVTYQKSPDDVIYVGLDIGIFYLRPGTTSWISYYEGLPNVPVNELEINYSIGKIRVATAGRGLWEAPIIQSTNQQTPFSGTPIVLPGTIEAENYDLGGQGIAYNDLSPGNTGAAYRNDGVDIENCSEGTSNVGWIQNGEWLEYTVNVSETALYKMDFRVASGNSLGSFQLEMDGVNITDVIAVNSTGSWQTWQTLTRTGISLTAGVRVLRVKMLGPDANLNKIIVTKLGNLSPTVNITAPSNNATYTAPASFDITATASDPDGTITQVEFFRNNISMAIDNTAPYSVSWFGIAADTYVLTARATDNSGNVTTSSPVTVVVTNSGQSPYGGTAWAIPGTVEAENYDLGGPNIAYNDLSAGNNGGTYRTDAVDIENCTEGTSNVGWIQGGEWLEYTVNITETATYNIDYRVSSANSLGSFQLELDGVNITNVVAVNSTGGWQNWQTVTSTGINLTAGTRVLRVKMIGSDFNLNKMVFTKLTQSQSPWGGTAASIPGVVETENYDLGGEGFAFHDVSAANQGGAFRTDAVDIEATAGGFNVGYIVNDEWLEYTVNVTQAGTYSLDARVASAYAGKTFRVELNGATIANISVPNTGGWQSWQNSVVTNIPLTTGLKVLRIYATSADFNVDKLTFTRTGAVALPEVLVPEAEIRVSPNPIVTSTIVGLKVVNEGNASVQLFDKKGLLISTLYEGYLKEGDYEFLYNASSLIADTYVIRYTSASGIVSKTVVKQ